jgi:hypothetical protein
VRADLTYFFKIWAAGHARPPAPCMVAVPTLRVKHCSAEQMRLAAAELLLRGGPVHPPALFAQS